MPSDLVELGRVVSAYGIRGWVKVQPHAADGDTLLGVKAWWLRAPVPPGSTGALPSALAIRVAACRLHGGHVVAQLEGIGDRDQAQALKGYTVWVPRDQFPQPDENEYYWVDLIGCRLYGEHEGEAALIGIVEDVVDNGAHGVLRVSRQIEDADGQCQPVLSARGKPMDVLVPFVAAHVRTVDLANRRLVSNWPAAF